MENTNSSTKNSNKSAYIIAAIAFSASIIATVVTGTFNSIIVQRQTETQLLINVYSLPDSIQQMNRLSNYLDLQLFSDKTTSLILQRLKAKKLITSNRNTLGSYTLGIGEWKTDPISGASFYIKQINKDSSGKIYASGKIRRPKDDINEKDWDDYKLPNPWTYTISSDSVYGFSIIPIDTDTKHCIFQIQKIN